MISGKNSKKLLRKNVLSIYIPNQVDLLLLAFVQQQRENKSSNDVANTKECNYTLQ